MSSSNVHDHLWIDILQHTQRSFVQFEKNTMSEKCVLKYHLNRHLVEACTRSYTKFIRMMIQFGADVNYSPDGGTSPLTNACCNTNLEVVRILLTAGANVNYYTSACMSALIWASYRGDVEIVRALLAAGADVNLGQENNGWTAFKWANVPFHTTTAQHTIIRQILSSVE